MLSSAPQHHSVESLGVAGAVVIVLAVHMWLHSVLLRLWNLALPTVSAGGGRFVCAPRTPNGANGFRAGSSGRETAGSHRNDAARRRELSQCLGAAGERFRGGEARLQRSDDALAPQRITCDRGVTDGQPAVAPSVTVGSREVAGGDASGGRRRRSSGRCGRRVNGAVRRHWPVGPGPGAAPRAGPHRSYRRRHNAFPGSSAEYHQPSRLGLDQGPAVADRARPRRRSITGRLRRRAGRTTRSGADPDGERTTKADRWRR